MGGRALDTGTHPAPVLRTERLILRGFVAEDFAHKHAYYSKPEVQAHLGPPMNWSEHWRRVVSGVGQWVVRGYGTWMVVRAEDDHLIGDCGLFDAQRGMGFDGEPEMGWVFDSAFHGAGYAREACEAVLDWADAHVQRPIYAIIAPDNPASQGLAKRLGFTIVDSHELDGDAVDIWRRD